MDCAGGIQRMVTHQKAVDRAKTFQGFGDSLIARSARRPLNQLRFAQDLGVARREVRKHVPVCPGVYGWLSADNTLLYVGKSKSLRHRLTSYFATQTTDPKMAKIRRHSLTLVWEPISHELLALIREQELISRCRPPYNVQGKPERQQPGYICISKGLAPTLFFAREAPKRAAHAFGPIAGRARLSEAIESLNYVFQLRNCPDRIKMQFSNQLQLFQDDRTAQCLRFELNTCLGPCAGGCSREYYKEKVHKAVKFLNGTDASILKRLQERMEKAASNRSFERAAVLRDQLRQIKWIQRRMKQISSAKTRLNGLWKFPGFDRQEHWMILRAGQIIACTNGAGDPESLKRSRAAEQRPATPPGTHLDTNLLMLLASWIKKYPEEIGTIVNFREIEGLVAETAPRRPPSPTLG